MRKGQPVLVQDIPQRTSPVVVLAGCDSTLNEPVSGTALELKGANEFLCEHGRTVYRIPADEPSGPTYSAPHALILSLPFYHRLLAYEIDASTLLPTA